MNKNVTKYWYEYAKNLLTSSGIISFYVGENFKKAKKINMDERMADKEAEKHRLSLIILLKQLIEVLKKDLAASEKRANENAIKELEKKIKKERKFHQGPPIIGKDSSYIESTSAAISSQNLEQQQKYVIIWELYDVCAVLDQMNPNFLHFSTTMNIELYSHLLRNVFKIVNFDTFKYTNVLDFPVDSPSKNLPQSSSKSNVGQQAALDTSTPFNLDKPIEKLNEIFKIYERFRKVSSFGELLQSVVPDPNEIITQIDNFENMPDANVLLYRECLDLIFRGGHQNVILSYNTIKATIAGALGRLLLYRMAEYVRGDDVFCIEKNNSEAFQQVTNKFQKESIIIVTRNLETKQLAVEAGLPCWFIRSNEDLVLFLEEIKLLVSQIQTLTGTPYKKRCEFCQEEIEQHLYLKHYVVCRKVRDAEQPPLAKKRKTAQK